MKCSNCGGENPAGAKFCEKCGSEIKVENIKEAAAPKFCKKCGSPLNAGDKFCAKCGAGIFVSKSADKAAKIFESGSETPRTPGVNSGKEQASAKDAVILDKEMSAEGADQTRVENKHEEMGGVNLDKDKQEKANKISLEKIAGSNTKDAAPQNFSKKPADGLKKHSSAQNFEPRIVSGDLAGYAHIEQVESLKEAGVENPQTFYGNLVQIYTDFENIKPVKKLPYIDESQFNTRSEFFKAAANTPVYTKAVSMVGAMNFKRSAAWWWILPIIIGLIIAIVGGAGALLGRGNFDASWAAGYIVGIAIFAPCLYMMIKTLLLRDEDRLKRQTVEQINALVDRENEKLAAPDPADAKALEKVKKFEENRASNFNPELEFRLDELGKTLHSLTQGKTSKDIFKFKFHEYPESYSLYLEEKKKTAGYGDSLFKDI